MVFAIAVVLVMSVAMVLAMAGTGQRDDDRPGAGATVPPATASEAAEAPALLATEIPQPVPEPEEELPLLLPDGSRVANLNGVTEVVDFSWPSKPYAPIVMVMDGPGGHQWYVHEDGTRSTTMYTNVNGERKALGVSASPTAPVPLDPGLLDSMYEQGDFGGR